jgi:hypothetical protein
VQASPHPAPERTGTVRATSAAHARSDRGCASETDAQPTDDAARDEAVGPALSEQAAQKKENEKIRSKDSNASLYPEHWLENIRVMLRDNRHDDAVRSLGEFRKTYPDYKLPDDLRDLK